jgi:hypothetical protein
MSRGIKASELVKRIQQLIDQYGDLYIYKDIVRDARPAYWVDYNQLNNRFEIV